MLKKLFADTSVKEYAKTITKEGMDDVLEQGVNQIHGAIRRVYYGLLIKAVIGIVVIVGAVTATIYGVSYLFSGVTQ